MKKIFNCLTVALVGLMIAACSGGGNEFIKEAESKVEIKEDALWGQLPSLADQYKAAKDAMEAAMEKDREEILKSAKDLGDAMKQGEEKLSKYEAKEAEIDTFYSKKFMEAAAKLKDKEVPCSFDEKLFSSAKIIILGAEETDKSVPSRLVLKAELVLASDMTSPYITFDYLNSAGEKGKSSGATYLDKGKKYKAGDKILLEKGQNGGPLMVYFESLKDFNKIHFSGKK